LTRYGVQPRYPRELEVTEENVNQALEYLDFIVKFFKEHIFQKESEQIDEETAEQ
jgi:hypothetical protein